jgi:hypothetical protein
MSAVLREPTGRSPIIGDSTPASGLAVYLRVSSDEQREQGTIETQRR